MLLTQLAGHLAVEHGVPTYLVSNRDPADVVSARLHANAARVPLGHLLDNQLTDADRKRVRTATQRLTSVALRVAAGPYARHRTLNELQDRAATGFLTAAFDDPSWETEWDLREARQLADRQSMVMLTLPDELLLNTATGQLHPRLGWPTL